MEPFIVHAVFGTIEIDFSYAVFDKVEIDFFYAVFMGVIRRN